MTHTPPSWSADLRGTTPDPRDRLLWTLAWYTYGAHLPYGTTPWDPATQPDLPTGWHRIDDDAQGKSVDPGGRRIIKKA